MINKLQKKLTALFMAVSFLLFFAIFALLVVKDLQSARAADRAMFQNQFATLTYQAALGNIANKDGWAQSSAIVRLTDEDGKILWHTNGEFEDVPHLLLENLEQQLWQIYAERQGDLPAINLGNIVPVKAADGKLFIGCRANIETLSGSIQTLEMLLPQTGIALVLRQNVITYLVLLTIVLLALSLLSYFLVLLALKPAKQSIESQKNFIAAASHELKSPLTVIQLNNAEARNILADSPALSAMLDISLTEGRRMARLISDMLALASSDAGQWRLHTSEISIETLMLEAYEKHSPLAGNKGIEIQMDLPPEPLPSGRFDKERMAQVFDILLDNAIGFSAAGGKIILRAENNGKTTSVSVIDHGSGISAKDKAFLFERFFQGDSSRTQQENFGLGLSIAKEIIELHSGKIEVKDTIGGGATFTFYI